MLRAPFGNVGCRNVRRSNEISALGSAQTVAPMSQGLRGLVLPVAASARHCSGRSGRPERHHRAPPRSETKCGLGKAVHCRKYPDWGGMAGAGLAAKAPPARSTTVTPGSAAVVNPRLYAKLPYDTIRDFAAVTLAVHPLTCSPSIPLFRLKQCRNSSRS